MGPLGAWATRETRLGGTCQWPGSRRKEGEPQGQHHVSSGSSGSGPSTPQPAGQTATGIVRGPWFMR